MSSPPETPPMLSVEDLQVTVGDHLVAVRDVSFRIGRGESVGLVGESGSGKTLTCRAVLGLLPGTGEVDHGSIVLGQGDSAVELHRRPPEHLEPGARDPGRRGLPGPRLLPQPVAHRRPPGRRGAAGPRRARAPRGPRTHPRAAARGRPPRRRVGLPPLPVRALGRHAPARHHRDRDLAQPRAADRRRGHHGPRHRRPGRDPGPAAAAAPYPPAEPPAGHPRPRGGRGDLRPDPGDVRRRDRRERPHRAGAGRSPAPLHPGA